MATTPNAAVFPEQPTRWDWWPLVRLLTVLSVFGAIAYFDLGWKVRATEALALPRRVFEVLSFLALLSYALAHLYLILLMFPLYAVVTLNDTFYDMSVWTLRTVFRMRSGRGLSLAGLCGEILLFGAAAVPICRALARL